MSYGFELRDSLGNLKIGAGGRAPRQVAAIDLTAQSTTYYSQINADYQQPVSQSYSVPVIQDVSKFFVLPTDAWLHIFISTGVVDVTFAPALIWDGESGFYDAYPASLILPIYTY